jgi:hypothetical protein
VEQFVVVVVVVVGVVLAQILILIPSLELDQQQRSIHLC